MTLYVGAKLQLLKQDGTPETEAQQTLFEVTETQARQQYKRDTKAGEPIDYANDIEIIYMAKLKVLK